MWWLWSSLILRSCAICASDWHVFGDATSRCRRSAPQTSWWLAPQCRFQAWSHPQPWPSATHDTANASPSGPCWMYWPSMAIGYRLSCLKVPRRASLRDPTSSACSGACKPRSMPLDRLSPPTERHQRTQLNLLALIRPPNQRGPGQFFPMTTSFQPQMLKDCVKVLPKSVTLWTDLLVPQGTHDGDTRMGPLSEKRVPGICMESACLEHPSTGSTIPKPSRSPERQHLVSSADLPGRGKEETTSERNLQRLSMTKYAEESSYKNDIRNKLFISLPLSSYIPTCSLMFCVISSPSIQGSRRLVLRLTELPLFRCRVSSIPSNISTISLQYL